MNPSRCCVRYRHAWVDGVRRTWEVDSSVRRVVDARWPWATGSFQTGSSTDSAVESPQLARVTEPDDHQFRSYNNVAIAPEAVLRLRIAEPDQSVVGEPAEAAAVERGHQIARAITV